MYLSQCYAFQFPWKPAVKVVSNIVSIVIGSNPATAVKSNKVGKAAHRSEIS